MPLPILNVPHQPSREDLIRYFHRTSQHWAEQIGEAVQLEVGLALTNPALPLVHDANHLREASLPNGISPEEAMRLVKGHFESIGTKCYYCVMNPSAPPEQVDPLIQYLLETGWREKRTSILRLTHSPQNQPADFAGLKILPARAAFRQCEQLALESSSQYGPEVARQLAQSVMLRLDDPHWDYLLALLDGAAVATAGALSVGDLGRVEDVYVSERYRGRGIAGIMLNRVLEICARSLFKHVLLEADPKNQVALRLYSNAGFEPIGESVRYHAAR